MFSRCFWIDPVPISWTLERVLVDARHRELSTIPVKVEPRMPFPLDPVRLRVARFHGPALPSVRRYRIAATTLFALDGAVFGSWASRIPDVAVQVSAEPATLGLALLCISLGALASMQLTGALCARLGPGLVGVVGLMLTSGALALPGLSTSMGQLAVALLAFGAATGMANVAANAVGVQVESVAGRPVLPSLHAGFSFGGLAGAAVGGLTAEAVSAAQHLLAVGACGLIATAVTAPVLIRRDGARTAGGAGPARVGGSRGIVVLLGVIAGCTAFGEGAVTDWAGLHLRETLGASAPVAAAGYAGFSLAMACGRLAGNRLLHTLGPTRLVASGGLLAVAGALAVATVPNVGAVLAGFVLVGLGFANVFPVAIARAGALTGPGGVATASTVGYTGLLGGPPLFGYVADAVGLNVAFATVAVLAAVGVGLARYVAPAPVARRARRPIWMTQRAAIGSACASASRRAIEMASAGILSAAAMAGPVVSRHAELLAVLGAVLGEPSAPRRPHQGLEAFAS